MPLDYSCGNFSFWLVFGLIQSKFSGGCQKFVKNCINIQFEVNCNIPQPKGNHGSGLSRPQASPLF